MRTTRLVHSLQLALALAAFAKSAAAQDGGALDLPVLLRGGGGGGVGAVKPTLDAGHSVHQSISAQGGTLQLIAKGTTFILVVPAKSPVHSLKELIDLGRREPNKHFYASVGMGSASHVASELFNQLSGAKFAHVPYKGSAPASVATIAGEVDMYLGTGVEVTNHIKAGSLRALGISSAKRSPIAPDVPTIAESGLPEFVVDVWFGVLAPAGTPRPIIDKLNKVIVDVVNSKEVRDGLLQNNSVPAPSTPEEFQARIKADIVKWAKVVKESGAKVE